MKNFKVRDFYIKDHVRDALWSPRRKADERWPRNHRGGLIRTFDSTGKLIEYIDEFKGEAPPDRAESRDLDFTWGYGFRDALNLYHRGWHEAVKLLDNDIDVSTVKLLRENINNETIERAYAGSFVDVDAFLTGEPMCMYEFEEQPVESLFLRIDIDPFTVAGTPPEEMFHRGIAIMSACMALRRMGVFLEVWYDEEVEPQSGGGDYKPTTAHLKILAPDRQENVAELMFILCHPAFYRQIWMGARAFALGSSSGNSCQGRSDRDFKIIANSGRLVIPGSGKGLRYEDINIDERWSDPKAATQLLKIMLKCVSTTQYKKEE